MPVDKAHISDLEDKGERYDIVPTSSLSLLKTAEGVLVWLYLLTKPKDWVIRKKDIQNQCKLGEDRYRKAIRDMRDCGLLIDKRIPRENTNLTTVERWCLAMPKLKPRKADRIPHSEGNPHSGKTAPIHKTKKDTQDLKRKLDTTVSNVERNQSPKQSIENTVTRVRRERQRRAAARTKSNKLTRDTVSAVWNSVIKETYQDHPVSLINSTTSIMYLTNTIKGVKLKDGEWKDILRYAITEWDYHRSHTFSWMVKKPMPEFPDYVFWQKNFRRFVDAYTASKTAKDGIGSRKRTPKREKTTSNREEESRLRRELEKLKREKKEAMEAALLAKRKELDALRKLEEKETRMRKLRRRRNSSDTFDDIETWEERTK